MASLSLISGLPSRLEELDDVASGRERRRYSSKPRGSRPGVICSCPVLRRSGTSAGFPELALGGSSEGAHAASLEPLGRLASPSARVEGRLSTKRGHCCDKRTKCGKGPKQKGELRDALALCAQQHEALGGQLLYARLEDDTGGGGVLRMKMSATRTSCSTCIAAVTMDATRSRPRYSGPMMAGLWSSMSSEKLPTIGAGSPASRAARRVGGWYPRHLLLPSRSGGTTAKRSRPAGEAASPRTVAEPRSGTALPAGTASSPTGEPSLPQFRRRLRITATPPPDR